MSKYGATACNNIIGINSVYILELILYTYLIIHTITVEGDLYSQFNMLFYESPYDKPP